MIHSRLNTRFRRLRTLASGSAAAALVAGSAACAPMAPYNPDRLPAEQMSRVGEICHTTMGLEANANSHYLACEESLSHALAARRDGGAIIATRHACEAQGLKPNTVALSECELHGAPRMLTQTDYAPGEVAAPAAKKTRSYFYASNDEVRRREQEACAEIGYDPVGDGFASCVASLQSSLFDADNPMH